MPLPKHVFREHSISAGDMSANISSSAKVLNECSMYSAHCIYSGTPTGTLKLQGSNIENPQSDSDWADISGFSVSLSGSAGSTMFNIATPAFFNVRVVYIKGSGSGTLDVYANGKN